MIINIKKIFIFFLLFFSLTLLFIYLCSFYNYFIASLFSLLILLSYYLVIEEFYFNDHLNTIEIAFIIFLNFFCLFFTIYLNNIIWVIFLLEIQTFLVFGLSALFKGEKYLKVIESSLSYLNPAFLSFVLILISLLFSSINKNFDGLSNLLLTLALMIKMGVIPYNFWVNQVLKNLTYNSIILVTLLNKLTIIVILINYTNILWNILFFGGILSLVFGCFLIVNTYNLKEFIAFSSIINSGWIVTMCSVNMKFSGYIINEELIGIFLISYYLGLIILLRYIDKSSNILRISSSATFFAGFSLKNFFINFSLLNLAGIPPLGGFIVKLIIIIEFTETYGVIFTLLVILSSILSIFAYIRPLIVMNNKLNFSLFYPVKINRKIFYTNNVMGLISIIILLITSNFLLIGV